MNKKYTTYSFPATKKPSLGTITFTQKSMPKVKTPTYKTVTVPFNRLAKSNKSNKSVA